jgi:hypothetical protein
MAAPVCCCAVASAAGSACGQVVHLKRVCWLHLAATFSPVDRGRYEARCRIGLLPGFWVDELNITASPSEGCGERESRKYTLQELQQLAAALPAPAGAAAAAVAAMWVEIAVGPLVLERRGGVEVTVHATSDQWKQGLLFDGFMVRPLPGPFYSFGWHQPGPSQPAACCSS